MHSFVNQPTVYFHLFVLSIAPINVGYWYINKMEKL